MSSFLPADSNGIARAVAVLDAGDLVAFPTETVYGLGADATNSTAVAKIFAAKGRPHFNPLIIHIADAAALAAHVTFTPLAEDLAAHFWPGPLTLVLPKNPASPISALASAGLPTLAVRVPAHPVARTLLKIFGRPVAAPSANASGRLSATTPKHVLQSLGDAVSLTLVGGRTDHGLESTILDLSGTTPRLLRYGAITPEQLAPFVGNLTLAAADALPNSPGQLTQHYAPSKPLKLNQANASATEALLQFGPQLGAPTGKIQKNLSTTGDLTEAAANFFMYLHELDNADVTAICVQPIPASGLGLAINDRLHRGAMR